MTIPIPISAEYDDTDSDSDSDSNTDTDSDSEAIALDSVWETYLDALFPHLVHKHLLKGTVEAAMEQMGEATDVPREAVGGTASLPAVHQHLRYLQHTHTRVDRKKRIPLFQTPIVVKTRYGVPVVTWWNITGFVEHPEVPLATQNV